MYIRRTYTYTVAAPAAAVADPEIVSDRYAAV